VPILQVTTLIDKTIGLEDRENLKKAEKEVNYLSKQSIKTSQFKNKKMEFEFVLIFVILLKNFLSERKLQRKTLSSD